MSREQVNAELCWYVIHTKPMQEDRAESNLRAWNVETLSPKIRGRRYNPYSGKSIKISKPLFPRYIFARFSAADLLHKISYTRGVQDVVSFGDGPCKVDDDIIEILKARQDADGFIKLGEELSPGDRVIINDGPLKNFVGVFEKTLKEDKRVSIMLSAMRYRVVLERESVTKAA